MKSGPAKVPVTPGSVVQIGSDGTFRAYGLDKTGVMVEILGPIQKEERFVKTLVSQHTHSVEIRCGKSVNWTLAETVRHQKEAVDPNPIEAGVPQDRPLSLHDEMKRFIRDEVSHRMSEHGFESLEESDDFAVPDDDEGDEPFSRYELSDMQEDAEFEAKAEAKEKGEEKAEPEPEPEPEPEKKVAESQPEA